MRFNFDEFSSTAPKIKVFGIGGGGNNAVSYIMEQAKSFKLMDDNSSLSPIELNDKEYGFEAYCFNTDKQALYGVYKKQAVKADNLIILGIESCKGMGAGTNAQTGQQAAIESEESIRECLADTDMVFIATGMGGGTGTGATPVIAKIAKEMGILTVAIVTKPFEFEGAQRIAIAEDGIAQLSEAVDSLIVIPNDKLFDQKQGTIGVTLHEAYGRVNQVLNTAVTSISDIILNEGTQNVDFADVKAVMENGGYAIWGVGEGSGEDKVRKAVEEATNSPLLEDIDISDAGGLIVNITAGADFELSDFQLVGDSIAELKSNTGTTKIGLREDPTLSGKIYITIIATGLKLKPKDGEKNKASTPFSFSNNKASSVADTSRKNTTQSGRALPEFLRQQSN